MGSRRRIGGSTTTTSPSTEAETPRSSRRSASNPRGPSSHSTLEPRRHESLVRSSQHEEESREVDQQHARRAGYTEPYLLRRRDTRSARGTRRRHGGPHGAAQHAMVVHECSLFGVLTTRSTIATVRMPGTGWRRRAGPRVRPCPLAKESGERYDHSGEAGRQRRHDTSLLPKRSVSLQGHPLRHVMSSPDSPDEKWPKSSQALRNRGHAVHSSSRLARGPRNRTAAISRRFEARPCS